MIAAQLRSLILAATLTVGCVSMAAAHHGWAWAQGEQTELSGTIKEISFAPPHPSLSVEVAGELWQIDLGNPRQTERSGFSESSAKAGDAIVILGNKSLDENEKLMKAVRITVGGTNYDMYPERIVTD